MSNGVVFRSALCGALLFAPFAVLAQIAPAQSFSGSTAPVGTRAPRRRSAYGTAVSTKTVCGPSRRALAGRGTIFTKVAAQHGEHSDGALYWKAYAQNEQGKGRLRSTPAPSWPRLSSSSWIHECGALEIEIQAKGGKPVEPKTGTTMI